MKLHDLVELTKPRLASLVIFTTGAGILLAPGELSRIDTLSTLVLTTLIVASSSVFNQILERDVDPLMTRTADRPLATRRMRVRDAAYFGGGLGALAVPALAWKVNLLTGMLGLGAWLLYVLVYTPMKQRSVIAVYVGAIPGATPVLMGWTAVTGRLDPPALALFAILFLWQIPHFIAISMFRRDEYARAGLKVLPVEYGDRTSLWHMLGTCVGLVVATMLPIYFGIGGVLYALTAILLASTAMVGTLWGIFETASVLWARRYFLVTLVYLPVLLAVLVIDRV
jgi:heme o synthase